MDLEAHQRERSDRALRHAAGGAEERKGADGTESARRHAVAPGPGEQTAECAICMDDVAVRALESAPCGHEFCSACWEDYLNLKISEAQVLRITCPDADCQRSVEEAEIRRNTSEAMFAKYQRFYREAKLMVRQHPPP